MFGHFCNLTLFFTYYTANVFATIVSAYQHFFWILLALVSAVKHCDTFIGNSSDTVSTKVSHLLTCFNQLPPKR